MEGDNTAESPSQALPPQLYPKETEFSIPKPPLLPQKDQEKFHHTIGDTEVMQPKKRRGFLNYCEGMFATRQLVSKKDPEAYVRTTIVELVIYLIFVTTLSIVTYGMTSAHSFYFTRVIIDLFLDQPFEHTDRNFLTSTNMNHFWQFTETTMLDGLYWENWYEMEEQTVGTQDQGILYENRLLGLPRLRQLRVKSDSCSVVSKFRQLVRNCYPVYSEDMEEKGIWHQSLGHLSAWKWHSVKDLNGSTTWSKLGYYYSGAGAYLLLGTTKADTQQKIVEIKDNLWITRATRAVFLDFTIYNANINLFCVVKLIWEFPATGGVITSWNIRTVRLIRYVNSYDSFILACEIAFCIFTLYYLLQEILEIFKMGICQYLKDVWSWLDVTILMISLTCIGFSVYRYILVDNTLKDLLREPEKFADFEFLGYWETQFNYGVAVCIFFAYIKIFKYISFNKTMTQLSSTLSRCAKDIGGFAIMFFIVFFAFAQLGYLLFGAQVEDFRTFSDSIFTLLRLILGDFNFREIESANRLLGPIFFLAYVFFVFFILLNMFLAIINDTYSEVKAEIQAQRNEFEVADYIKRGFNNMMGIFGKRNNKLDVENAVKLAAADGQITYTELRNNLRGANFSDVEVAMFLARYELDQERTLDEDETQNILSSLEGRRQSVKISDIAYDRIVSAGSGCSGDHGRDMALTEEEISDMQHRVGSMESALTGVTHKIDGLIGKLESLERKNKS